MRSFAATCSLRSGSASSGTSPALMRRASSAASSRLSNKLLLASSSRRAIASAFIATRVRNFIRWSSSVGRSSPARNSKTASISSGAVGRSLIGEPSERRGVDRSLQTAARAEPARPEGDIASDVSRRLRDQVEELVFHLRCHPAQHRVLDAAVDAGEMSATLRQAADAPLDVAEHFPPVEVGLRDRTAGQLSVAGEVRADLVDAAETPVLGAEAPSAYHRPGDVLARVGEVRELPVEQVLEPAVGDDDVPDPEVAVGDDVLDRLGPVFPQPPEPVLERGPGIADGVELMLEALDDVSRAKERKPLCGDRVDLRQLVGELGAEAFGRVADDAPADGLALHELHRERLAAAELAQVSDGPGHLDAGLERGLEHLELVLQREGSLVDHPPAGAAHE